MKPLKMCVICRTITESMEDYKFKGALFGKCCEECSKTPVRKIVALLQQPERRYMDLKRIALHG